MIDLLESIAPGAILIATLIIGGFALRFALFIWQELIALAVIPTMVMVGVFTFWPETEIGRELYFGFFIFFAICLAANRLWPDAGETKESLEA